MYGVDFIQRTSSGTPYWRGLDSLSAKAYWAKRLEPYLRGWVANELHEMLKRNQLWPSNADVLMDHTVVGLLNLNYQCEWHPVAWRDPDTGIVVIRYVSGIEPYRVRRESDYIDPLQVAVELYYACSYMGVKYILTRAPQLTPQIAQEEILLRAVMEVGFDESEDETV